MMRSLKAIVPVFLVGAALAGCQPSGDDAATSPSNDQTVAIASPASPTPSVTSEDALAAAAQEYAARETPLALVDDGSEPSSRYFDVIDCNETTRSHDPNDASPRPEEIVARRVALLRRSLQLAGYGGDVIDGPLAAYAADPTLVADPDRSPDGYAKLAAALDAKRIALHPDLPPIRAEGGCGAAETPILIRTRPAGGHVWLATKFSFDLCRARRLDPWDRTACDRWSEVGPDRPVQLSGTYAYQAQWPGGRSARGTRRIDPVADDVDSEAPQIITVDRQ